MFPEDIPLVLSLPPNPDPTRELLSEQQGAEWEESMGPWEPSAEDSKNAIDNNHGNTVTRKTRGKCPMESLRASRYWFCSLLTEHLCPVCTLINIQGKVPTSHKTESFLVTAAPLSTHASKLCLTLNHTTQTARSILQHWYSEYRRTSLKKQNLQAVHL